MSASHDNPAGSGGSPEIPDHELLRRIGGGSYGEVWLARAATGVYRAVKILHRSRFGDDQHPFEREFQGLQRFEPVSRGAEHVVDILHIGRHDDVLYYVMELADAAPGQAATEGKLDAGEYVPDTLSERLRQRGRLKITECIEFARALGQALAHLHAHGLVHRDVKPSNVIFVDGILKLADVGLVSAPDATVSLVGTEGFIPPEGPGTEQADLFAMGKILYEMSSGLDRMEFPGVPNWVCDEPGDGEWSEFNEVVLKCCEKDAARRYQSAQDVLTDLELLETGKSLVRRRRGRRLWQRSKVAAVVALAASGLFGLGAMLVPWRAEPPASDGAEAISWIGTSVNLGEIDLPFDRHMSRDWDCSPDGRLLAIRSGETLVLWDRERELARPVLVQNSHGWRLSNPRWLEWPRELACLGARTVTDGETEYAVLVIDAQQRLISRVLNPTRHQLNRMSVSRGRRVAAVRAKGDGDDPQGLLGIELDGGAVTVWDENRGLDVGEFSPDGRWLALTPPHTFENGRKVRYLWLFSPDERRKVRITCGEGVALQGAWSPDGRFLYFVSGPSFDNDETINLFRIEIDLATGQPLGDPERLTARKDVNVLFPHVVPDTGELFAVEANQNMEMWAASEQSAGSDRHLGTGNRPLLSRDGKWVYYLDRRSGKKGLYRSSIADQDPGRSAPERLTPMVPLGFEVSPDGGSLVVASCVDGRGAVTVRDLATGDERVLATISGARGAGVRWSPDGARIAFTDGPALFVTGADGSGLRELTRLEDWDEEAWEGGLAWSPDSSMIAGLGFPDASAVERECNQLYVVELNGALRCVTPEEGDFYKSGLRWHPEGDRLSYTAYGLLEDRFEIRQAFPFPEGTPSELLVGPDHDPWMGTWHPDGRDFYFLSLGGADGAPRVLVRRDHAGGIFPAEAPLDRFVPLPQWSADGSLVFWTILRTEKRLLTLEEQYGEGRP